MPLREKLTGSERSETFLEDFRTCTGIHRDSSVTHEGKKPATDVFFQETAVWLWAVSGGIVAALMHSYRGRL
jgi:hypothetical protein